MKGTRRVRSWLLAAVLGLAVSLPAAGLAGEVRHVVLPGDDLHLIAAYYYGDPRLWEEIYQANRALGLRRPSRLTPGQELRIPDRGCGVFPLPYPEWRDKVRPR
jgi:hypothetical protein